MQKLSDRLESAFGFARLPHPIFHTFEFALRFELGTFPNKTEPVARFLGALDRARAVVHDLFEQSEKVSVVVAYTGYKKRGKRERKTVLQVEALGFPGGFLGKPEREPMNDTDYMTQFGEDLYEYFHCAELPEWDSHADVVLWSAMARWPIRPVARWASFYLIDFDRRILISPYDDRGMDVAAMTPDILVPIYTNYSDWLLDYDRAKMDADFAPHLPKLIESEGNKPL